MSARDAFDLIAAAGERWLEPAGLVAGFLISWPLVLAVGLFVPEILTPMGLIVGVTLNLLTFAAWLWSRRMPRAAKGRVGIAIGFLQPDSDDARRFGQDFEDELRRLLSGGRLGPSFQIVKIPAHHLLGMSSGDTERLMLLRQRARCSFILFGHIRARSLSGKEHFVLDLRGGVAHKPIPLQVQKAFQNEFTELLPYRTALPADENFLAFVFTGTWTTLVARYVIGIAAALSGDLAYAEQLYLSVQEDIPEHNVQRPPFDKLVAKLPERLAEIYEARANAAYRAWLDSQDEGGIEVLADNLAKIDPQLLGRPRLTNLRAISLFLSHRNVVEALGLLDSLRNDPSGQWYVNVAFLHAYQGDMRRATRMYRHAALFGVEAEVPSQVEEFMIRILRQEPERTQLHYCLGFMNMEIKGDLARAREEFTLFLEKTTTTEYPKERRLVLGWMASKLTEPKR